MLPLRSFYVSVRHCTWKASGCPTSFHVHRGHLSSDTPVTGYAAVSPHRTTAAGAGWPASRSTLTLRVWRRHHTPAAGVPSVGLPPLQQPIAVSRAQVTRTCPTWLQVSGSHHPLLGVRWQSCSQNSGTKHCSYRCVEEYGEGSEEQPDEEVRRGGS